MKSFKKAFLTSKNGQHYNIVFKQRQKTIASSALVVLINSKRMAFLYLKLASIIRSLLVVIFLVSSIYVSLAQTLTTTSKKSNQVIS